MTNLESLRELVNRQAEDHGLWFNAKTAPEAYLQQELRKLHAAIEVLPDEPPAPPAVIETASVPSPSAICALIGCKVSESHFHDVVEKWASDSTRVWPAAEPEAQCTCSTEIKVVSIDPACPQGHGKGLPPRPLTVPPAEPACEHPQIALIGGTQCTTCKQIWVSDTGPAQVFGELPVADPREPGAEPKTYSTAQLTDFDTSELRKIREDFGKDLAAAIEGDALASLGKVLYERMEHMDPSHESREWTQLTDRERELYITCAESVVVALNRTHEPTGNAAGSRPWICPAHGQQWGDTCPQCQQLLTLPRADQWTPEEMARFRMQQAQNMCQGCFRPVSACVCSQMNRRGEHGT